MTVPIYNYCLGIQEGNIKRALQMIADTEECAANSVKFQSFFASELVSLKLHKTRFDHFISIG